MTRKIWLRHMMLSIPLAAFLHSALQFAHAYSRTVDNDWVFFPVHWAAGMLAGSLILAPAFTIQAYISVWLSRRGFGKGVQIPAGGLTQATLVALWARFVGIEPSLAGNFSLTEPMIGAAFLAGGAVAMFAAPKDVARPERPRRVAETERVFGYGSLRAFMNLAAMICFGGGVVLAFLLREEIRGSAIAFGACAAVSLFCWWGAYLMGAEVSVSETSMAWSRGRREVVIPWLRITEIRSTMSRLLIRSEESKIVVDKQLDDYASCYELVRKYAPPYAWETLSLPLRCRASLLLPGILCTVGSAWIAFMWWMVDYSPPADSIDLAIVIFMTSLGGCPVPIGLYVATFRCEFDFHEIRVGTLFRRKTYEVANLVD
ncbi:MAG: hypothetical protein O7A06_15560, partial [Acidobacteria bacterium]|nr:hypothetical protein [Acidobacteriota bacterium]